MRSRGRLCAILALAAFIGGVWLWSTVVVDWIEPHPGEVGDGQQSENLPGDLKLMWKTKRLGSTHDLTHGQNPRSSTDRAINAASRVFNTVELVGKTRDEVVTLLGDPKSSSDSIYNFPFWPAPKGSLVYRFDSGAYGWQFNAVLGEEGRVSEVERHWIH
jgi:hypothetical protein